MKLKKDFIVHSTGDETVLVPTGSVEFIGLVKGNKTFGYILEMLRTDTDEAKIIAALKERFDAPDEKIERDVARAIAELRSIGAIDG